MNAVTMLARPELPGHVETGGREQAGGQEQASGRDRGDQVGDIVAAWELSPGSLLLLGWQHERLPSRGTARLGRRQSDHGPFRCIGWEIRDAADGPEPWVDGAKAAGALRRQAFALAVRLPEASARGGQTLVLRPDERDGAGPDILARLPERLQGGMAFAAEAVRLAAGNVMPLTRFLVDVLVQPATAGREDVGTMLGAFLAAVCEPDGCIEILAGVPEGCVALQGWGRADLAVADCIWAGTRLVRRRAQVASFPRADIALPCTGTVLVMPPEAASELSGATSLYLLGGEQPRRRDLVAVPRVLEQAESAAHLRDLLPSLRGEASALERLRWAARPRFSGRDTLNTGIHAVRAAVDLAVRTSGGAYLHGWLLDPSGAVDDVTLRSTAGRAERIDNVWTRIPRADVSEAFRAAGFAPGPEGQAHGFAVRAASMADPQGALHLDVTFRDGTVGFLPLGEASLEDVRGAGAGWGGLRARLLGSVDLHKPSGVAIVERHLAPLFLASERGRGEARVICGADPGWDVALVVALPERPALPRALMSQFLYDPLGTRQGLVLVCGDAWQDGDVVELRAELAFRSLPAMLLRVAGPACSVAALQAAATVTEAANLLVLGAGTHGRAPGWRTALLAAQAAWVEAQKEKGSVQEASAGACFCATQLYEDYSIRFAGIEAVRALAQPPWFAAEHGMAGLPAELARGETMQVLAGSLAACLVPRAVALALAGGSRHHATPEGAELDFFLRLRSAEVACFWVPSAQVYALDSEAEPGSGRDDEVARLVEGWCLRATWLGNAGGANASTGSGAAPGAEPGPSMGRSS